MTNDQTTTTAPGLETLTVPDNVAALSPTGGNDDTAVKAGNVVKATKYGTNDGELGRRLGDWLASQGNYLFVDGQTRGMIYDAAKGLWTPDNASRILDIATYVAKFDGETVEAASALPRLKAAVTMAQSKRSELTVTMNAFDNDPYLLAHPDAMTTDLRTGVTRPSSPLDRQTKSTAVAPDRTMAKPEFDAFMGMASCGDESLARYIQHVFGVSVFGTMTVEVCHFLAGPSNSGKSTVAELVQAAMGEHMFFTDNRIFLPGQMAPNQIADLKARRIAGINELPESMQLDSATFKNVVTAGTLSGRALHSSTINFVATASFICTTNFLPKIAGADGAVKRRGVVIPFEYQPVHRDVLMRSRLMPELPAILAWIIEGARESYAAKHIMPECQAVETATAKWRDGPDLVAEFIELHVIAADPSEFTKRSEIGNAWKDHLDTAGASGRRMQVGNLTNALVTRKAATKIGRPGGEYAAYGMKLLPRDENGWTTRAIKMLVEAGDPRGTEFAENIAANVERLAAIETATAARMGRVEPLSPVEAPTPVMELPTEAAPAAPVTVEPAALPVVETVPFGDELWDMTTAPTYIPNYSEEF